MIESCKPYMRSGETPGVRHAAWRGAERFSIDAGTVIVWRTMDPIALAALRETRLISVIRASTREAALKAAKAVVAGGVPLVEITFTVPDAPDVMRALASTEDAIVGAGTVLTAEQARA